MYSAKAIKSTIETGFFKTLKEVDSYLSVRSSHQQTHQGVTTYSFKDGSLIQLQDWGDNHPAGIKYTLTEQDKRV